MSSKPLRYLKEDAIKIYNCTFELELHQLQIELKFPCQLFVEWKTSNNKKLVKNKKMHPVTNGKVIFDEKLLLQVEMIYDQSQKEWLRRDTTVNVYLVTKNRPNYNQLAGRIPLNLSLLCEGKGEETPVVEKLQYASTDASLQFAASLKYSMHSDVAAHQVDLSSFYDRLMVERATESLLSKSKSLDFLKHNKVVEEVSTPVHLIRVDEPSAAGSRCTQKSNSVEPFHYPLTSLMGENRQRREESSHTDSHSSGFSDELRMTINQSDKTSAERNYRQFMEMNSLAKDMKKSDLMVVPDLSKSHIEDGDSDLQTDRSHEKKNHQEDGEAPVDPELIESPFKQYHDESKEDGHKQVSQKEESQKGGHVHHYNQSEVDMDDIEFESPVMHHPISKKTVLSGFKNELNHKNFSLKERPTDLRNSTNSQIDIAVDLESDRYSKQEMKSIHAKIRSSKEPGYLDRGAIDPIEEENKREKHICESSISYNQFDVLQNKNIELSKGLYSQKNRIKELEADSRELVKMITQARQSIIEEQNLRKDAEKRFKQAESANEKAAAQIAKLEQDLNYEVKVSDINRQKLKELTSIVNQNKMRRNSLVENSEGENIFKELDTIKRELTELTKSKSRLELRNADLLEKLNKRDEIELQNEVKIQELEEELKQLREQQQAQRFGGFKLGIDEVIKQSVDLKQISAYKRKSSNFSDGQGEYWSVLEDKIRSLEDELSSNLITKQDLEIKITHFMEKESSIKDNVAAIERQFSDMAKNARRLGAELRLEKQKTGKISVEMNDLLEQIEGLQNLVTARNEEIAKKQEMLDFCSNQIKFLEDELAKVEEIKAALADSIKEGQSYKFIESSNNLLKTINEESPDSVTSSLAFSINFVREQKSVLDEYRQALKMSNQEAQSSLPSAYTPSTEYRMLRKQFFDELHAFTNITIALSTTIEGLEKKYQCLQQERESVKKDYEQMIHSLRQKCDKLEEQKGSYLNGDHLFRAGGSSAITPSTITNFDREGSSEEKVQRFSQATKKKPSLKLKMSGEEDMQRQIEKLKSIIYDKNKEMGDLIACYEKLKLEKEKQQMKMKSLYSSQCQDEPHILFSQELINEREDHLVHDILDLQLRLKKEKKQKNMAIDELSVRRSLNKSQEGSNGLIQHYDLKAAYQNIALVIQERQGKDSQSALHQLIEKINALMTRAESFEEDQYHQGFMLIEEKSMSVSKELQKLKAALFKLDLKTLKDSEKPSFFKASLITLIKPCQSAVGELLNVVNCMTSSLRNG